MVRSIRRSSQTATSAQCNFERSAESVHVAARLQSAHAAAGLQLCPRYTAGTDGRIEVVLSANKFGDACVNTLLSGGNDPHFTSSKRYALTPLMVASFAVADAGTVSAANLTL